MPSNPEAIWERLSVTDHVILENQQRVSRLEAKIVAMGHRMNEIERRQRKVSSLTTWLRQVASPREWIIGVAIALALAAGAISPGEIRGYVLGQSQQQR